MNKFKSKYFKILSISIFSLMLVLLNSVVYASGKNGWVESENGYFQYYINEKKQTGWKYIDDEWYYLNKNGEMQTDWIYYKGRWYYLNENGTMKTGWLYDSGRWYYLNENGTMKTGWLYDSGRWYYLNENGTMKTGWLYDSERWYYLNKSGAMQTDWIYYKVRWYYLNKNGAMKTGWLYDSGKWYYLNKSGAMQTGWLDLNKNYYLLNKSGALVYGNFEVEGVQYYTDKSGRAFVKDDYKDSKKIYAEPISSFRYIKSLPAIKSSSPKKYTIGEFEWHGVIYWKGHKFTYYSESVLPGGGLDIPGRVTRNGFVTDKDGYIVLASNRLIPKGTIIDTPFGAQGKVYDRCPSCSMDWFDVYTR